MARATTKKSSTSKAPAAGRNPADERAERLLDAACKTASSDRGHIRKIEAIEAAVDAAVEAATTEPDFYSYADLQRRWGLGRKAIERLNLPRLKIGNSIRFKREDVKNFEADAYEVLPPSALIV